MRVDYVLNDSELRTTFYSWGWEQHFVRGQPVGLRDSHPIITKQSREDLLSTNLTELVARVELQERFMVRLSVVSEAESLDNVSWILAVKDVHAGMKVVKLHVSAPTFDEALRVWDKLIKDKISPNQAS